MAIYNTLQSIHHLLVGYHGVVTIFCDNRALIDLLDKPLTNRHAVNRLDKWLRFVRMFNYEIHHIDGKKNVIADALSRVQETDTTNPILPVTILMKDMRKKLTAQSNSVELSGPKYGKFSLNAIKSYWQTLQVPNEYCDPPSLRKQFIYEFYLNGKDLYKIGSKGGFSRKVVTDPKELEKILTTTHELRGHLKVQNAFNMIN